MARPNFTITTLTRRKTTMSPQANPAVVAQLEARLKTLPPYKPDTN